MSGMGVELVSHIAAGVLLGLLVDRWTGMKPTWLVVGAIAGLVVGMTNFIRVALKASREAARVARAAKKPPVASAEEKSDRDGGNHDSADRQDD
ncbi:MAG: AtpZ/AtpI family protein [Phycisphaerales bacterium]|nr:MAG: AtpZ/AtpI family protein [Phycisphaerales bacterium]